MLKMQAIFVTKKKADSSGGDNNRGNHLSHLSLRFCSRYSLACFDSLYFFRVVSTV